MDVNFRKFFKNSSAFFFINLSLTIYAPISYADNPLPILKGNFALSTSQQPGPLVSFGQNIIDKGELQFYLGGAYYHAHSAHTLDIIPTAVYAFTDNSSLFLGLPVVAGATDGTHHTSGIEDAVIQFEYAFVNNQDNLSTNMATIVAAITAPTGSAANIQPLGAGAPSYFIGGTYNHMTVDWYSFVSSGALLSTTHNGTRNGNQLLYQGGVGHHIRSQPNKFILMGLVELNGTFAYRNRVDGYIDQNSGGNTIFVTPSIYYSTQSLICQLGIGIPLQQHLFGNQPKNYYYIAANFGIKLA